MLRSSSGEQGKAADFKIEISALHPLLHDLTDTSRLQSQQERLEQPAAWKDEDFMFQVRRNVNSLRQISAAISFKP